MRESIINLPHERDYRLLKTTAALMRHGSDKFHRHRYDLMYEQITSMERPRTVFEIGVYKGQSLNAWAELFPYAELTSLDLRARPKDMDPRVKHYVGDQTNRDLLLQIEEERGPFDLIIEDGAHTMYSQKFCYENLFPMLTIGGWYVCEDLHTSELIERSDEMRQRFNPEGETETALDYFLRQAREVARARGYRDGGEHTLIPDRQFLFYSCAVAVRRLHDGEAKLWP